MVLSYCGLLIIYTIDLPKRFQDYEFTEKMFYMVFSGWPKFHIVSGKMQELLVPVESYNVYLCDT